MICLQIVLCFASLYVHGDAPESFGLAGWILKAVKAVLCKSLICLVCFAPGNACRLVYLSQRMLTMPSHFCCASCMCMQHMGCLSISPNLAPSPRRSGVLCAEHGCLHPICQGRKLITSLTHLAAVSAQVLREVSRFFISLRPSPHQVLTSHLWGCVPAIHPGNTSSQELSYRNCSLPICRNNYLSTGQSLHLSLPVIQSLPTPDSGYVTWLADKALKPQTLPLQAALCHENGMISHELALGGLQSAVRS